MECSDGIELNSFTTAQQPPAHIVDLNSLLLIFECIYREIRICGGGGGGCCWVEVALLNEYILITHSRGWFLSAAQQRRVSQFDVLRSK